MSYHNQRKFDNRSSERNWLSEFQTKWITEKIDRDGIKFAEEFGRYLKNNMLTTSQIRNIFGEIKRIQMAGIKENQTAFLLLKPKMAYAVARDGKRGLDQLTKVVNKAFDSVAIETDKAENHYQNFVDFFEAILAYHKAAGGK
jgi:CRISPR-associated protein Csm2